MSRIRSRVVKATIQDPTVLGMFQGVLGGGDDSAGAGPGPLHVLHPKWLRIRTHADRFLQLLELLATSAPMGKALAAAAEELEAVAAGILRLRREYADLFDDPEPALAALEPGAAALAAATRAEYDAVPADARARWLAEYQRAKDSSLVGAIIVTCKNLVSHKRSLADPEQLRDGFLTRDAGNSFAPIPVLPELNFKRCYRDLGLAPADREFFLVVLHKLYRISHDMYEAMTTPDVDVDEFIQVIMSSIDEVRKHIPRCDAAFDKIIESVSLLKGNFGGYYKDFVASNNPTIIMENFVLDVSQSAKASPSVTAQFRKIISHYRKIASQGFSNPKMQHLFSQVDKNFQELEKRSRKADAEGDGSGSSAEEVAGPATAVEAAPDSSSADEGRKTSATGQRRVAARRQQARQRRRARVGAGAAVPAPKAEGSDSEEGLAAEFASAI